MIGAWWLILLPVAFFIGLFLGLRSRKQMNYDHQFQDHYLPEEPRNE